MDSIGMKRPMDEVYGDQKRARDEQSSLRPGGNVPSNVCLVRISNIFYPPTIDALHTIFRRFGNVIKIVCFDKGSGYQALIQYDSVEAATQAFQAVDMQDMYTNCNTIRVGFSNLTEITVKNNTDRSWDFTTGQLPGQPGGHQQSTGIMGNAPQQYQQPPPQYHPPAGVAQQPYPAAAAPAVPAPPAHQPAGPPAPHQGLYGQPPPQGPPPMGYGGGYNGLGGGGGPPPMTPGYGPPMGGAPMGMPPMGMGYTQPAMAGGMMGAGGGGGNQYLQASQRPQGWGEPPLLARPAPGSDAPPAQPSPEWSEGGGSPLVLVQNADPAHVRGEHLAALFGLYGDVLKVKVMTHKACALVQYAHPLQAANAMAFLNDTPLAGQTLRCVRSTSFEIKDQSASDFSAVPVHRYRGVERPLDPAYQRNLVPPGPRLAVANVGEATEEALRALYGRFGAVSSVALAGDGTATVEMSDVQTAVHALIMTHHHLLEGAAAPLLVAFAP